MLDDADEDAGDEPPDVVSQLATDVDLERTDWSAFGHAKRKV